MQRKFRTWMGKFGVALALALTASTAVLAQDVTTNFQPGTDISKYRTYKWVPIEGGAHPNQIVDIEVRMSVDTQLAHKGLAKVDSNSVDLYVGYQAAVAQEKQWTDYGTGGGLRWGAGMARRRVRPSTREHSCWIFTTLPLSSLSGQAG